MNELQSLSQIFQNKLFRIPDYQRGYAWRDLQLRDFWEDLVNLQPSRNHYTGLLSVKEMNENEKKTLASDDKWLLDSGFKPYQIVDGQQRLTTFVILLNELIEFVKSLPEYADSAEDSIYLLGYENIKEIRSRYICRKKPPEGIIITYIFGYENDNPSAEYLKHKILGENYGGTLKETYYTKNLANAKCFFAKEISLLFQRKGKEGLNNLYQKLTQHFMFNIHEIEDDYDVFVAFETMNNRGKPLTNLELLKNRMIYLTTLFDESVLDAADEAALRAKINKAWKEVYYQLGRNQNMSLSDDEFLRAHWIIYFSYSRKKGDDYITFLLRKFSQKNIYRDYAELDSPEEDDTVPVASDEYEADAPSDTSAADISENTSEFLAPKEILDYVNSLNETAEYWYYSFYPEECPSISKEEKVWIGRLNRIGISYFRPLVTVSLIPRISATPDERIAFYKAVERFIFIDFRLAMYQSSYQSSEFYRNTRKVYRKEMELSEVTKLLNKITEIDIPGALQVFCTKMDKRFISGQGFYSWRDLKYFLYEYEYSLVSKYKLEKLQWADLAKVVRDQVSVEHILPQTPSKIYWRNQFRQFIDNDDEMKCLAGSLGNLVPLSKSINSKLQNDSFQEKKERGYYNGCHSEIEVSKEADWDAQRIYDRGIKLLRFMEKRWNFKFASQEQMDELLHISFINDGRVIPSELEEDENDTADQTNNELRLQYWGKALPILADAFGGKSTYSNVVPSARSSMDGYVGLQGVHLYCAIKIQKKILSANIWIDVGDKGKNKQIFDALYQEKSNAEASIPYPIEWRRKEDLRSSTINVERRNIDFSDISLWDEQIKFLADTCVKLKTKLIDPCADTIKEICSL